MQSETTHPDHSALLHISTAVETATTLDELLMLGLSQLATVFGVPRAGILLTNEDETGWLQMTHPPQVQLPPPPSLGEYPPLQHIARSRSVTILNDVIGSPAQHALAALVHDTRCYTGMVVPLIARDRVIGVLGLASTADPRDYPAHEQNLARVLTSPLAAGIVAFQSDADARRRADELATLNEIANAITSSLDMPAILRQIVRQINRYFHVEAGAILLRDALSGDLEFTVMLQQEQETLQGTVIPRGRGVAGWVAETGNTAIVLDPDNDPRFFRAVSDSVNFETRSILCVPIINRGHVIGVIELLNKTDGAFSHDDARRLQSMATTIGIALENARLFANTVAGREQLAAILNSTSDGMVLADHRRTVVIANPPAAQLFDMPISATEGQDIDTMMADLMARAYNITTPPWLNDDNPVARGSTVTEFELGDRSMHQYVRHFSLPVYDRDGLSLGELLIFQDVTNDHELNRMRDDFTGMLVHDLRAPLTAIMNGIDMVQRGLGGPVNDQQQQLLRLSYQSSQNMLEMVNTLLDIARMEKGSIPLNSEPFSVYTLVDDAIDRLRATAEGCDIRLHSHMPVGLPLVEADRGKILRVLQNLLDNAIKFSPVGSTVTLGAQHIDMVDGRMLVPRVKDHSPDDTYLPVACPDLPDNEWLIVWVRDEGEGIPPEYHERIFEKFGQVRRKRSSGTGIGLTFSRLTVEAHGGYIWLESEVGHGSTFAFALPLLRPTGELTA